MDPASGKDQQFHISSEKLLESGVMEPSDVDLRTGPDVRPKYRDRRSIQKDIYTSDITIGYSYIASPG